MISDAISDEIYRIKAQIAEECGFDSTRFGASIREIELRHPERIVISVDQIPPTGGNDVPDETPIRWIDPIMAEVRRVKEMLAVRYNYDIHAMFEALRERDKEHADRLVTQADLSSIVANGSLASPQPNL